MIMWVENFGIESKSKRGFEKGDMHVVISIEPTTIVSSIPTFQPKLVPMFFHMVKNSEVLFRVGSLLPLLSSSLV
jgi:hypothetical protein